MQLTHAACSDIGKRRTHNEDSFLLLPDERLFAVCDGMGGHAAGEVASKLACEAIAAFYASTRGEDGAGRADERRLADAIRLANAQILEAGEGVNRGMGTTCVTTVFADGEVIVGHVGDSRAYRFRDGALTRLTADHSLVEEYLRTGRLTPETAKTFPQRNVILRALGTGPQVDVDVARHPVRAGDVLLLCSDGLSGMLTDQDLTVILTQYAGELETCAKALVDAANANGGLDNVTCVLARVGEGPTP